MALEPDHSEGGYPLPGSLESLPDRVPRGDSRAALEEEFRRLDSLQIRLGYRFRRPALLRAALTLSSWCNEHPSKGWSGNGTLERNEVLQSLDESRGQGKGQAGNAAIMKKRFEEMDWDKNGNISYLEFLFALESWVGIEDQEDEDY